MRHLQKRHRFIIVVFVVLAATLVSQARAQGLNSAPGAIVLHAVVSQSLSVTLVGGPVNFILVPGTPSSPGSTSVTAITTWAVQPSVNSVKLYAFFANSALAMTDGTGNNIPAADFQISDNGGAFAALTNTVPFGGANAGLLLSTTPIVGGNRTGSRTDVMIFNINLSTLPNLPPNTYTGTLTIQAQAI